ncbi:MAG: hypothetical protein OEM32_04540 [Acidimicrobiia bacterium]|nr:hypothetical protein [Acidimicrobiia bacterium]
MGDTQMVVTGRQWAENNRDVERRLLKVVLGQMAKIEKTSPDNHEFLWGEFEKWLSERLASIVEPPPLGARRS